MMKNIKILPRGCYLSCMLLASAGVQATTLQQAVNAANHYDAGISAARNSQAAGLEKRTQGFAGLLPSVQLESSYYKQDQPQAKNDAGVTRHSYSVNLTQPLFDMSKFAAYQRGDAIANSADMELLLAQQKMISEVADAFFQVLYQRDVLQAARSARQTFERQLEQAKMALRIGEGIRTDVDEAQANFDRAQAQEIAAVNDLEVANGVYQRLTGMDAEQVNAIPMECVRATSVMDLKTVMQQAAIDNLEVRAAQFQLEQSKADLLAANGAHLPVVSLQASYGTNWSRSEQNNVLYDALFGSDSKTRNTTVGINVSVPLFAGGGQLSQSREAISRREQSRDSLEDARRKARQEARSSYLGITNGLALFKAQERTVASAQSKVKSTQYGREMGQRTVIDELNAEQGYYDALRDMAEARYKYLVAKLKFSAALGRLDYAALGDFECNGGQKPGINSHGIAG
ncbi:TolC family outer membrane protein [Enterobacter mori]|uniref:TolC family outer membrane protein n=1 Tax=Enterobacter mori TaxID=539813 RepID=UPI0020163FCB|nr:TolC family outer membrane protein [Enterobacter mori]